MEAFTSSDLEKKGGSTWGTPSPQYNIHLEAPTQSHAFVSRQQRILLHGRPVVSSAALCSACSGTKPNKQDFPHSEQYFTIFHYLWQRKKRHLITWITLIGRPVSFASVSRICLVGFGVCKRHHENQRPAIKKRESIQKSNFCINSTHKQIVSCLFAWSLTKDSGFPIANAKLMVLTWSKANLRISSCLALIVVRGPRRFVPPGPSSPL